MGHLGHAFLAAQSATYCKYTLIYSELCFSLFYRAQLWGMGEGERAGDRGGNRDSKSRKRKKEKIQQQLYNVLNIRWWRMLDAQGVIFLW